MLCCVLNYRKSISLFLNGQINSIIFLVFFLIILVSVIVRQEKCFSPYYIGAGMGMFGLKN